MFDALFPEQTEIPVGLKFGDPYGDFFCGGGGTSEGASDALGYPPTIALNHCHKSICMPLANHPATHHILENIWKADIVSAVKGQRFGFMWFSPDCTHFSRARGGKPTSKNTRGLAWSIVMYCEQLKELRPIVLFLENVPEFLTWEEIEKWKAALKKLGYRIEFKTLVAADYGAPTIRKRLFMIARRDNMPIVWPEPTHGKRDDPDVLIGKKLPWRTAASVIDFNIPCPSIFDTQAEIKEKYGLRCKRPLADNTLSRIAAGIVRYVLEAEHPFFVTLGQHGGSNRSSFDPMSTICASRKDQNAIVVPTLVQTGYGERKGQAPRVPGLDKPLGTIVSGGGKHALVAAFMAQHNTGVVGHPMSTPLSTITGRGTQQNVVAAHMISLKGNDRRLASCNDPLNTICAGGTHAGLVAAFLTKYYGSLQAPQLDEPMHTVTTKDRFGLVMVSIDGQDYVITDIGMRMLHPRELYNAQGFPSDYKIDPDFNGKPLGKTDQIEKVGNSVPPPFSRAIIAANCPEMIHPEHRRAA